MVEIAAETEDVWKYCEQLLEHGTKTLKEELKKIRDAYAGATYARAARIRDEESIEAARERAGIEGRDTILLISTDGEVEEVDLPSELFHYMRPGHSCGECGYCEPETNMDVD